MSSSPDPTACAGIPASIAAHTRAVESAPTYRADIDALRAVAVQSVVGFHAFPFPVPGGFVGVGICLVISVVPTTGIIVGELRSEALTDRAVYASHQVDPAGVDRRPRHALPDRMVPALSGRVPPTSKHLVDGSGFPFDFLLRSDSGPIGTATGSTAR